MVSVPGCNILIFGQKCEVVCQTAFICQCERERISLASGGENHETSSKITLGTSRGSTVGLLFYSLRSHSILMHKHLVHVAFQLIFQFVNS